MSIYSHVNTGTKVFHSRFTKSISYNMQFDARFGALIPVLRKFCLPGDVWRIGADALIRLQPMLAPPMNKMICRVRYFFVPIRLVEPQTELILTGSKDGHLFEPDEDHPYPVFKNIFADGDKDVNPNCFKIIKHSFWDYMGCQVADYEAFKDDECLPAQYWSKGYARINWDFYRDENLSNSSQTYDNFDDYLATFLKQGGAFNTYCVNLPKDYFTSSLPWQLKAPAAPVLNVTGNAIFNPNFDFGSITSGSGYAQNDLIRFNDSTGTSGRGRFGDNGAVFGQNTNSTSHTPEELEEMVENYSELFSDLFKSNNAQITGLGFTAADERIMFAQTRIFERLARCGSRYTEFLHANFGIAPADDTLQRAQYLGGWKMPIVTTEVVQTAGDSSNPVGTLRGHGISRGGNKIKTFICREFGMIFGLMHILPEIKYTTGCPRELSYKRRFDFFNPSLQHLSEQEVRNGELFIGSDGKNDDTFGFQAYANELRSSQNIVVGDMRDTLSYWNQAITFASRPNLNHAFIYSNTYRAVFNKCFAVSSADAYPIIVDFQNYIDVYRPMVRYGTPGLIDHL